MSKYPCHALRVAEGTSSSTKRQTRRKAGTQSHGSAGKPRIARLPKGGWTCLRSEIFSALEAVCRLFSFREKRHVRPSGRVSYTPPRLPGSRRVFFPPLQIAVQAKNIDQGCGRFALATCV